MMIAWVYLDKKTAALDALKDYSDMKYIIQNHKYNIEEITEHMTSLRSSVPSGTTRVKNPHSGEERLICAIDEIDVFKERYRRALEYMEWFTPAWNVLSEDEQFILTQFFLTENNKTEAIDRINERLFIERSQIYFKRDKAVNHLVLLLYGK